MPELPEVETVRRTLRPVLLGRRVLGVTVRLPKLIAGSPLPPSSLRGDSILDVRRRAKILVFRFRSGRSLLIHLKMTGQLLHVRKSGEMRIGGHPIAGGDEGLPNRYTQAVFTLDDQSRLFFNDVRKFGYMRLYQNADVEGHFRTLGLGPEPLGQAFQFENFRNILLRRAQSKVKDVLLDQGVIAGIGNIYADEVNFSARLHPRRVVRTLSEKELRALFQSIRRILALAVQKRGTTFSHFRDGQGYKGGMQAYLKVYGREGKLCFRCRTLIVREKIGGRSAHYCPSCQLLTRHRSASTLPV